MFADTTEAFPQTQVLGVDRNAMILVFTASANDGPASFLLLEIETSRVWQENDTQENTGQAEPRDNIELGLGVNVVVENSSGQCTQFPTGGRETVRRGTDSDRVDLGGGDEGDGIRSELVEKG